MRRRGWEPDGTRAGGRTALAAASGVHISVISRALNEGRTPDIDSLRLLGQAFGYNLGEMLVFSGRAERDELPVRSQQDQASAAAGLALAGVDDLPDGARSALVSLVQEMVALARQLDQEDPPVSLVRPLDAAARGKEERSSHDQD